jgi:colicin import membrane protein
MTFKRLALSLVLVPVMALAQTVDTGRSLPPQDERARIQADRTQAQTRFTREESACYQKFAVNDCINEARARRRETLADLRRQELSLAETDRKRAGADQIRRIEEKSGTDKPRPPGAQRERRQETLDVQDKSAERHVERSPTVRSEPSSRLGSSLVDKQKNAEEKAHQRQQRASEAAGDQQRYEQKQKDAAQRKVLRDKRLAERKKPLANPLPAAP